MIDRTAFLADAQKLVARLEKDLRARCDDMPEVGSAVEAEYRKAKDAGRTGQAFEEWRADAITQQAVAWVLSCVFVRFLEDNRLIDPPRISGPVPQEGEKGENRLARARDEHELFFRSHPHQTDRDYLLAIFDDLAGRPGTRDLFGPHNPIRAIPNWLSPDAAKDDLLPFFQRIEAGSGRLLHDFTDPSLDTRFLGDLYQDLSEAARKKYALLQTPVFVEEFILDRTLTPTVETFGLEKVKLIDPACGSGHFVLGAFSRLLDAWARREPATPRRELVRRALDAVHGVDLNPYAVAVARFRLLLAAWRECAVLSLANAPEFRLNLACGDSLLHGSTKAVQGTLGFAVMGHTYQPEDAEELERLLRPGIYHAVVANPPYITPKDRGLNEKYRERYSACYMKYPLAVPFMQRIFDLACEGGFTGQITANSFMKREFGRKLIQEFLPTIDLTHVIDTSGAHIPGPGVTTVMLFGRNRRPVSDTLRTVMGIRGEPTTPDDPANGQVWLAIVRQIDRSGSQSGFVTVADLPRTGFHNHPWSIGGGGATELKEQLDEVAKSKLNALAESIGIASFTLEDDAFLLPMINSRRRLVPESQKRCLVVGDVVRDWQLGACEASIFPYASDFTPSAAEVTLRYLWPTRTCLANNKMFGGKTKVESGLRWFEYGRLTSDKLRTPLSITFAFIATHNHFVLDRGGKVFNRTAPVIKLPATATEADHLALLGLLNSSTACFWLKQVSHNLGSTVDAIGARKRTVPFEDFWEHTAGKLTEFPLPAGRPLDLTRQLDALGRDLAEQTLIRVLARWDSSTPLAPLLADAHAASRRLRGRMIALQEDLDWQCYRLYGLLDDDLGGPSMGELSLGKRAFEVVMARKMRDEGLQTTWFTRHGSTPTTETDDPLTLRRIAAIEGNTNVALIEQPEYKRRWSDTAWEDKVNEALHAWLLDRLESYFDLDGRMNERGTPTAQVELSLISTARLADIAGRDPAFQAVAALYTALPEFDPVKLVAKLVEAESVPLLPVLRYKPSGIDKRVVWERTWDLQRREDAIDARATKEGIGVNEGGWTPATDDGVSPLNKAQAGVLKRETIGQIPAPPKYKSADFQKADYWRLRGGLDVPKERWVIFPHCQGPDGQPLVAWAGYDHLQLAKAIAAHYVRVQEQEGGRDDPRLVPLLACLAELLPWLKQWHNGYDAEYGVAMGDYYEGFVQDEARQMGRTIVEVRAWQPPARAGRRTSRKTARTPVEE